MYAHVQPLLFSLYTLVFGAFILPECVRPCIRLFLLPRLFIVYCFLLVCLFACLFISFLSLFSERIIHSYSNCVPQSTGV